MNRSPWIAPLLLVLPFASACASNAGPAASPGAAESTALPDASSGAKLCGKTEPVKFKLRKDVNFYFDVNATEPKEGCTGFTIELGEKIDDGKTFTKKDATAHFLRADGGYDNSDFNGSFTVVVKSFKPTTDPAKPGKCSGELKASSTDKKFAAEVAGQWESECWLPKPASE